MKAHGRTKIRQGASKERKMRQFDKVVRGGMINDGQATFRNVSDIDIPNEMGMATEAQA